MIYDPAIVHVLRPFPNPFPCGSNSVAARAWRRWRASRRTSSSTILASNRGPLRT